MTIDLLKKIVLLTAVWSSVVAAHDLEINRLSDDSSNPLFYAVMVGRPFGTFAAFAVDNPDSCSLRIYGTDSDQIVMELMDYGICGTLLKGEEEDGYSYLNATGYHTFLEDNKNVIKAILNKYQIDHGASLFSIGEGMHTDSDQSASCVDIETIQICVGKSISVNSK